MEYQKIPLEEQLEKISRRLHIHPKYASCAIRELARMPITAYMEDGDCLEKLGHILEIPNAQLKSMSYRDVAQRIGSLRKSGKTKLRAEKAMRILAGPMAEAYGKWKEGQKNAQSPT